MRNNVKNILMDSGWNESRLVNSEIIINLYITNGYPVLDVVVRFMQNFYGLIIKFTNLNNSKPDDISFNLEKALDLEAIERVIENYEPRVGRKMCIIGTAFREHFVLLMDELGCVYGGYDSYLVYISDSGIGAIEAIINNNDFLELN